MSAVRAPILLFKDSRLSTTAKVLWLAQQLPEAQDLMTWRRMWKFSPTTMRKALTELHNTGWLPGAQIQYNRNVTLPAELVRSAHVTPQAKLLYGLLLTLPDQVGGKGTFTYPMLVRLTQVSRNTIKEALQSLQTGGWLRLTQGPQRRPIPFELMNPVSFRRTERLIATKYRLSRAPFRGEALMREYLSLLVGSDLFEDDAAPGFLVNPVTRDRLQFDRFYSPSVAFEFNGDQHYGPTDWFPSGDLVKEQQLRDLFKAGICFYRGITLVIVHAEDLSLEGMSRKIGALLPRRDLTDHDLVVQYLEKASRLYRHAAHRVVTQTPGEP